MAAPWLSIFLFLFIGLRINPALGAIPRFGAFDDATLLRPPAGGGFAPRWYMDGIPAMPAQLLSPNPRHGLGGDQLGARDVGICPAGSHSCVEVNAPGTCCPNDRYCYFNSTWGASCCSLGVKCENSKCSPDQLYCNQTSSTTLAITASSAGGRESDMVTSIVSVVTSTACCNRPCSASSFSCEKYFGGQCCPYGYKCLKGNQCVEDPAPPTSTLVSSVASEIPSGCTTSQVTCTDGGGCCNLGSVCTFQSIAPASSRAACARDPALSDGGSSSALSSGARAGIGVGVAVGAAIIIAVIAWLCIRRRKQQRSGATGTGSASAHEMRFNLWGQQSAGGGARSGVGDHDQGDSLLVGPNTPFSPHSGFSDTNGAGLPYIGPVAVDGPFTDRGGDGHPMYDPALATTPPALSGDGRPYGPDDILRPVELGVGESQKDIEGQTDSEHVVDAKETPTHDEDPTAGPFELMGSMGTPSPLNSDELGRLADKSPSLSSLTGKGPKQ
ncbi:hypothetical protein F4803DRAFT_562331 [Xylaria telfairii]|nr:hypothetical protein F4803DRAFT_562331 [Xylaria telfairii]